MVERAQLIFEQSFERAISNEHVSLFSVICVFCLEIYVAYLVLCAQLFSYPSFSQQPLFDKLC